MTGLDGEILFDDPSGDKAEGRTSRVKEKFWQTLAKAAGQIGFIEELVAAYYCALDPATPSKVRLQLIGALAYFVMPVDTIPDFLAGFGFADDVALLSYVIGSLRSHIGETHRAAARKKLDEAAQETAKDNADNKKRG